jgi:hypothetical protein
VKYDFFPPITVYWDVRPCRLVNRCSCFWGSCYCCSQDRRPCPVDPGKILSENFVACYRTITHRKILKEHYLSISRYERLISHMSVLNITYIKSKCKLLISTTWCCVTWTRGAALSYRNISKWSIVDWTFRHVCMSHLVELNARNCATWSIWAWKCGVSEFVLLG